MKLAIVRGRRVYAVTDLDGDPLAIGDFNLDKRLACDYVTDCIVRTMKWVRESEEAERMRGEPKQ